MSNKVVRQVLAECPHGSGMAAIALDGTKIEEAIILFPCQCRVLVRGTMREVGDTIRVDGAGPRLVRRVPPQPARRA